jgi:tetratricopeptide (TPR) repeat protein
MVQAIQKKAKSVGTWKKGGNIYRRCNWREPMKPTSALSSLGRLALKIFLTGGLILSVLPVLAQQGGGGTRPSPPPSQAPAPPPKPTTTPPPQAPVKFPSATNPWDQNELIQRSANKPELSKVAKDENCFLPPLNGLLTARVGIGDLQIPAKAQRDYADACEALRNSKTKTAESHLRKAVKHWPKYLAAWVVLGQVLESQQKLEEGHHACSQPLTTDSHYLPAYLCLADVSAHSQNWGEVLQLSVRALEIDPTTVAVAYDYNAAANFHLHYLREAEKSALRAAEIDKGNIDPRVHFLLAQIYEAKGDRAGEAAELREYLKFAVDPNDVAMVKHYLAELDEQAK